SGRDAGARSDGGVSRKRGRRLWVNDLGKCVLYFLLGGSIVSFSTYLGSQGKSFLAAMASTFPAITGVTFILLYMNGGGGTTVDYAKNLLWFAPPWIVYISAMIMGITRLGFWPAMAGALALYMGCIGLLKLVLR